MRMKLFAVAALAAIPAAALAQTYLVYPNGAVVQAEVIDPSAPVYYSQAPSQAPATVGNPVVYSSAPQGVYQSGQIAYAAQPVLIYPTTVTQKSGESGPGTIDKPHPGTEAGLGPSPRDAGTSSAGSN